MQLAPQPIRKFRDDISTQCYVDQLMKFLPNALRRNRKSFSVNGNAYDPQVLARVLIPKPGWSVYAMTFDGTNIFYGFVEANRPDTGYANLNELLSTLEKLGSEVVRDWRFKPCRLSELRSAQQR